MPQPTATQVHVNRPLTNISVAYLQALTNFIAMRVFPVLPVDKQTDIYTLYTKNDWYRDEAKVRAAGTESTGSGYNIDNSNTYSTLVRAIHKDVSDQIRNNADLNLNLDRDATEFVTRRLLMRLERDWATSYFGSGIWATDNTPANLWSDYVLSTPISDIQTAITTIMAATGFEPNTLVLGWEVFAQLKHHPDIRDVIKYTSAASTTPEILGQVFDIPRVLVAKAVYATNVEGETAAYSFTHGKNALVCFSQPSPSLLNPSAGYVFSWRGMGGNNAGIGIKSFRVEDRESTRIEGQMAWDSKVIGADLGYMFNSVVA